MRAFRFPLQPALDAASAREREAARRLSGAERELARARGTLGAVEHARREAFAVLAGGGTGTVPSRLRHESALAFFLDRASGTRARAAAAVVAAEAGVAEMRRVHAAARTARGALERLRERRFAEHLAARERRETAELDESNALRSRTHSTLGGR